MLILSWSSSIFSSKHFAENLKTKSETYIFFFSLCCTPCTSLDLEDIQLFSKFRGKWRCLSLWKLFRVFRGLRLNLRTVFFRKMDKLTLARWFNFKLEPISGNDRCFFVIKIDTKIIILLLLQRLSLNPWYISSSRKMIIFVSILKWTTFLRPTVSIANIGLSLKPNNHAKLACPTWWDTRLSNEGAVVLASCSLCRYF